MNIDPAIPYSLKSDDGVAVVLLICFFLLTYILAGNKKYLLLQGKNFILHKDRTSLFASSSVLNAGFSVLLILQTCFLASIILLSYINYKCPDFVQEVHPHIILSTYILAAIIYILFKWVLYSFIGWIFFDKSTISAWLDAYSTLVYYLGFILFPYTLLLVYFDVDIKIMLTFALVVLIIAKILILYKWLKFFFNNIYGLSLLILYFCALEIMPCFLFYRAWLDINSLLLTKF